MSRRATLFVLALLSTACGAEASRPPITGRAPSVLIENQSNYVLLELRIHEGPSYAQAQNELTEDLEIGAALVYYGTGSHYFTVFRKKSKFEDTLAFTTQVPLYLERTHAYRLLVFDEAFRFVEDEYVDPETNSLPVIGDPKL